MNESNGSNEAADLDCLEIRRQMFHRSRLKINSLSLTLLTMTRRQLYRNSGWIRLKTCIRLKRLPCGFVWNIRPYCAAH